MRFWYLTLLASLISISAKAVEDLRVPGGVAVIPVESGAQPTFNGKPVLTIQENGQSLAVIGLGLSIVPGDYTLQSNSKKIPFKILPKKYLEQRIYLENKRHVTPNSLDLDRIKKESKKQRGALDAFNGKLDSIHMILPVEGPISGPFGKRRFFNDQPRRPHSGTDIAAPNGTPIKVAASGRVSLVGDFFFNGRLVVVDHGEGLKTMYNHMDQVDVKENQVVSQGELIGTVGSTGRSTGPHLHLGVVLNGVSVDPALFIPEIRWLIQ
ncbi:MAG: peptidase M23 [Gammaproteobacteria bacterium]|nr:peptidase M23 [Gammaproteobacteria bacterium]|tara:strand:+ start:1294 stop:2094 length:801 start_codon:yes stop_codon:yes gene_type:complete